MFWAGFYCVLDRVLLCFGRVLLCFGRVLLCFRQGSIVF